MSLWRSKRRYDTGRRLSDQADDALYALALLQSDGSVTTTRADELRENLQSGQAVLEALREALEAPAEADPYTYTIAERVRDRYGDIAAHAIDRFDRYLELLSQTEEDLTYREALDDVVEVLEAVEDITAQTTDQDAQQLRSYGAQPDR